ncbi:MAG: ribosomal protein S18-alanine N-acetyltransferase [Planctomycetaceae bacterium]|jgi:ribosomal-protein-alanine N-acetyltransferase|nr:ribosomal protein S18-alanine N-acetyltransferase [Planctomycetaceae bacterium]
MNSQDNDHQNNDREEIKVYVRWMVRRDFPEVLAIEQSCFEFPWKEEDFIHCLQQRNCIGMVAEYEGHVVGFMIYEVPKNRIHLLNIATAPEFRRRGVAGQMVRKLVGKLVNQRRSRIVLEVRETNLPALVFFRALGFRATVVIKNFYDDMNEDAYVLQYRLHNHSDAAFIPSNRITTRTAG